MSRAQNKEQECVILLHGLARSKFSMKPIERVLKKHYRVLNLGYPSRSYSIEELASRAVDPALAACEGANKIHFVTHSLGGIILREYLSQHSIDNLGNVVMLGPPNQGSELVDFFQSRRLSNWLFRTTNGPAGAQLSTQLLSKPKQLGSANFSLGIIAGKRSLNPIASRLIVGPDDGKVSVNSSKLAGMKEHLVLNTTHTFMMRNPSVIRRVRNFLSHASFADHH